MGNKEEKRKVDYWKNFRENYPIVLPNTFTMIVGFVLLFAYIEMFKFAVGSITDPYIVGMYGILFILGMFKLISWVGYNTFSDWVSSMVKAFYGEIYR